MKWNLRLAAANRGIWKASELQRMLAEAGLVISAGKMSGLWSGHPASIKLDDLDVICAVVGCGVQELLITEPGKIGRPAGVAGRTSTPRPRPGPGGDPSRPGAVTGARSRLPDEPPPGRNRPPAAPSACRGACSGVQIPDAGAATTSAGPIPAANARAAAG
jgi:DNA-binding Xre family transcriptional regulator